MLRGRDILCISSVDWDSHWQIHHEIMTALVAAGNRVLFVDNTGVRPPQVGDFSRLRQRLRNWWRGTKGFREERQNLFVYSPLFLPFPYSRVARWINRVLLSRALRRWMWATGFSRPIGWTFLPTPLARDLICEVHALATVYYCADDFASSSASARRIERSEAVLFREADLVFVTSEKLRERAARFSTRVHLFPAGVNFQKFESVRAGPDEVPSDIKDLPHPVVGYVGALHQWVDQDLLASVARHLPEASFALVGPPHSDLTRLSGLPNVHLLGGRPHGDVPRYIKGFDVGIVPYRMSEYTASVYPVKLNEYLSMGIPVVATDLPEIRRFNQEHGDMVLVASDPERFAGAIRTALDDRSPSAAGRRIEVARRNSWESRLDEMSSLIEQAIEARQATEKRWEETLRRMYRTARRRSAELVLGVVGAFLLFFYTPFVWMVAEPLRVAAPPLRADAIVVFAGGVGESGQAGGGYQERVKRAVELYQTGEAPTMIFSSGFVFAFREAEVMKVVAMTEGVPASAIILETEAANTYENVTFVRDILEARGWHRILLVSSPYHMRRALLTWHKVDPGITVVPTPVSSSQFYVHERGASLQQIRGIAQEYAAIVVYWWRGWI